MTYMITRKQMKIGIAIQQARRDFKRGDVVVPARVYVELCFRALQAYEVSKMRRHIRSLERRLRSKR